MHSDLRGGPVLRCYHILTFFNHLSLIMEITMEQSYLIRLEETSCPKMKKTASQLGWTMENVTERITSLNATMMVETAAYTHANSIVLKSGVIALTHLSLITWRNWIVWDWSKDHANMDVASETTIASKYKKDASGVTQAMLSVYWIQVNAWKLLMILWMSILSQSIT